MSLPRSTVYAPPITSASSPSSIMGARGVRAHKGDSDDLDREKRNERKNVQPNVFHSSYLLKFFGSGEAISQSPRLQLHDSISRACCKIHNSERYILRFRFNSKF